MSNTVEIIRNSLTSKIYDGVPIAGGGGSALTISNVGDGSGVFKTQTSSEAFFKSLKPGQNIGFDSDSNTITINYTGTSSANLSGYITTGHADSRYYDINNPSGYITNSGFALISYVDSKTSNLVSTTGNQNINDIKTFLSRIEVSGKGIDLLNASNPNWKEGRIFYDNDEHTLAYYNDSTGVTINVGQEMVVRVVNKHDSTITNGQVVYVDGAQGNRPTVKLALASDFTADKVLGVVTDAISNNGNGYTTLQGIVRNLDTSSFSVGDALYLSSSISGALTNVEPPAPNHTIKIGLVLNSHFNQGMIFVNPIHIDYDLSKLHDTFILTGNLQDNDLLSYNSSSGKWLAVPNFSGDISNRINSTGSNLQSQINNLNQTGNLLFTGKTSITITGSNILSSLNISGEGNISTFLLNNLLLISGTSQSTLSFTQTGNNFFINGIPVTNNPPMINVYEHFLQRQDGGTKYNSEYFQFGGSNGGSVTYGGVSNISNTGFCPGIIRMDTNTTASSYSVMSTRGDLLLLGRGPAEMEVKLRMDDMIGANSIIYCGFVDIGASTTFTDGAAFYLTNAANTGVNNIHMWSGVTRNNSVQSAIDMNVTGVSGKWYILNNRVDASGTLATFTIMDEYRNILSEKTLTTNIPTGANRQTGGGITYFRSAGLTANYLYLDYLKLYHLPLF